MFLFHCLCCLFAAQLPQKSQGEFETSVVEDPQQVQKLVLASAAVGYPSFWDKSSIRLSHMDGWSRYLIHRINFLSDSLTSSPSNQTGTVDNTQQQATGI